MENDKQWIHDLEVEMNLIPEDTRVVDLQFTLATDVATHTHLIVIETALVNKVSFNVDCLVYAKYLEQLTYLRDTLQKAADNQRRL